MEIERLQRDAAALNKKCREQEQQVFDAESKLKALQSTMDVRLKDLQVGVGVNVWCVGVWGGNVWCVGWECWCVGVGV
jgi:hypothetical protein